MSEKTDLKNEIPKTFESRIALEEYLIEWTERVCGLKESDWDRGEWDLWVDRVWATAQVMPIDGMLDLMQQYCEMTAAACGLKEALVGAYQLLRAHGEQLDGMPYYEELESEIGDFREMPNLAEFLNEEYEGEEDTDSLSDDWPSAVSLGEEDNEGKENGEGEEGEEGERGEWDTEDCDEDNER